MKPLFPIIQRLLPQHLLSRFIGAVAGSRWPPLKRLLISQVSKWYGITLEDYIVKDPGDFASFNDFFTRALDANARPVDPSLHAVVSPVDGTISQLGDINNGQIIQAKDKTFSGAALLGNTQEADSFVNGRFMTIYLAPHNYHRIHMPVAGTLTHMRYIPGKLFSVNNSSVANIDNLFARNERVVCFFETPFGKMALVMVGALNVGSIETVHEGVIAPGKPRQLRDWSYPPEHQPKFEKGQELGRFNLGSTVVLMFASDQLHWRDDLENEDPLLMGAALGAAEIYWAENNID